MSSSLSLFHLVCVFPMLVCFFVVCSSLFCPLVSCVCVQSALLALPFASVFCSFLFYCCCFPHRLSHTILSFSLSLACVCSAALILPRLCAAPGPVIGTSMYTGVTASQPASQRRQGAANAQGCRASSVCVHTAAVAPLRLCPTWFLTARCMPTCEPSLLICLPVCLCPVTYTYTTSYDMTMTTALSA